MKKYYFTIASILVLVMGIASCSNEERKTQNETASRPSIPINALTEIRIGTQIWTIKNLDVDHYRNGDPIPQVTDPTQWSNLTSGAWCYYANNSAYEKKHCKLYNGYAVIDPRGLVPQGWHLPTSTEINALRISIQYNTQNMKARNGWPAGATNSSGFTAYPSGLRDIDGSFFGINQYTYWWNSNINVGVPSVYICAINTPQIIDNNYDMKKGLSVRCVKD